MFKITGHFLQNILSTRKQHTQTIYDSPTTHQQLTNNTIVLTPSPVYISTYIPIYLLTHPYLHLYMHSYLRPYYFAMYIGTSSARNQSLGGPIKKTEKYKLQNITKSYIVNIVYLSSFGFKMTQQHPEVAIAAK